MVPSLLRGEKVLFRRSNGPGGADSAPPPRFRVNFAEVQRMKLRKLQCQVVRDVAEMRSHGREAEGWEENLEKYVKALQDYDYMQNRARSNRDPFLVTGEYYTDNYILGQYLSAGLQAQELETAGSVGDWETDDSRQTVCGTRGDNLSRTWFVNFRRRVAIAAVGGLFLVGPMWLMVLYNKLYAQLISTTVFVTAFGIVMAIFLNKDDAVLASTAAYAAVLVVFVGTSTSGDGGAPPSL
ncbi:uncharacterized protein B0H64DRAFT_331010 [Chaetomium fimeti]|uniref:DUF6594 domain-containing protein n=1 Tax=Chaetomium fimeti TaxID=1854472 RepID=A0AAE0H7P5_9PEZI|nr:hypothetical protein B0H64DRAFT_331010 [Chaetomium fimeti]